MGDIKTHMEQIMLPVVIPEEVKAECFSDLANK